MDEGFNEGIKALRCFVWISS